MIPAARERVAKSSAAHLWWTKLSEGAARASVRALSVTEDTLSKSVVMGFLGRALAPIWASARESRILGLASAAAAPRGRASSGTYLGCVLAAACLAPTEAVFALALAWMPVAVWLRHRAEPRSGVWDWPRFEVVLAAGSAFAFVAGAALAAALPLAGLKALFLWTFYFVVFFESVDVAARGEAEDALRPFLWAVALSSVLGILQQFSGGEPPSAWLDEEFRGEIVRVTGTFTNPTFFAEMIALALPVTLALLLVKRPAKETLFLGACAALQAAAFILTSTRGAWLGFIASFALLSLLFDWRLLAAGAVMGGLFASLGPSVLLDRFLSSFSMADSSNSYRLFIWRGALALARAHLFRGVGLGAENFGATYPEYMIIQTPAPHAHSTYLEMLIELGLPGFAALGAFFVAWGASALGFPLSSRGPRMRRWAAIALWAGVIAALAGHGVHALVEFTWYNPRVTAVFWAWLGVASGIARRSGERG